jgi:hypothetical protein
MADTKITVLLTGASGLVGGILRAQWADGRYALRLADIRPLDVGTASHWAVDSFYRRR